MVCHRGQVGAELPAVADGDDHDALHARLGGGQVAQLALHALAQLVVADDARVVGDHERAERGHQLGDPGDGIVGERLRRNAGELMGEE